MTREEERRQASIEYTINNVPKCIGGDNSSEIIDEMNRNHAFEEGAKWADKTIIEKACKWLEEHQDDYEAYDTWKEYYTDFESLIIDFRKAIEN